MPLDLAKFYLIRRRFFWAGIGVFMFGAAAMVVDLTTEFPTPSMGEFAGLWTVIMLLGGILYYFGVRLPLREAIELAADHGGRLTLTELATGLQINLWTADQTLKKLRNKELIYLDTDQQERDVWVFRDLVALPLDRVMHVARERGRVSAEDFVKDGISTDLARRALLALVIKDLLREDQRTPGAYVLPGVLSGAQPGQSATDVKQKEA